MNYKSTVRVHAKVYYCKMCIFAVLCVDETEETRLRTFAKITLAHSHVYAQFNITIAHITYVNKVLRLSTLKNHMFIVPLPLARYKLYICCPLLTTGGWK